MKRTGIFLLSLFFLACNDPKTVDSDPDLIPPPTGVAAPKDISFTILSQHPHDTSAYTQGLEMHDGKLFEGTGDYNSSSLRITDWITGKVEKIHPMGSDTTFGEGITIFKDKIYQLTWQNNVVYVYDLKNIDKPVQTIFWPNEGWGITHDSSSLIISDGSANLYFVDPSNFKIKNTIAVKDNLGNVNMLNELEYVDGFIYANVYETDMILKIDAESGHVVGRMNLAGLLTPSDIVAYRTNVLNGIAYDLDRDRFLITGKRWPKLFELKLNN
jgi:glutaminyl-peptide cyclotransferase